MAEQAAPVLPDVPNGDSLRGRELSPGVALNKLPPLNAKCDLSALKPPEAELVNYLRAHPGKFFDRATLNHMVFNDTYALPTINFYIWSIREKLGRGSIKTRLYRNNRPAGYAWVVEFVGGAE